MLLALKQGSDALPAAGVCLSPIFDLALTGDSVITRAERDPMILASSLQKCSTAYRGKSDPHNPLMSPLYGDLAGLPPLLLQCGSEEMLRDDSVRLAAKAKGLGRKVLAELATIVTPETLLRWHQRLIARKYEGSGHRRAGRPRTAGSVEDLVVQMAEQNRDWGYRRIQGALSNPGIQTRSQHNC